MKRTVFTATAFAVYLLIGNLCLNGALQAKEVADTLTGPLFSENVTQCPLINRSTAPSAQTAIQEERESPCASGNCFREPHIPDACASQETTVTATASLPAQTAFAVPVIILHNQKPVPNESPPPLIAISTVVLRM